MPSVHEILLNVTGNATDARATLAEMAADLAAFSQEDAVATLEVRVLEAQAHIAEATAALQEFDGREATAEIRIKNDLARAGLERIQHDIDEFRARVEKEGALKFGEDEGEFLARRRDMAKHLAALTGQVEQYVTSVTEAEQREYDAQDRARERRAREDERAFKEASRAQVAAEEATQKEIDKIVDDAVKKTEQRKLDEAKAERLAGEALAKLQQERAASALRAEQELDRELEKLRRDRDRADADRDRAAAKRAQDAAKATADAVDKAINAASKAGDKRRAFDRIAVVVDVEGLDKASAELDIFKAKLLEAARNGTTIELRLQAAKALTDIELVQRRIKETKAEAARNDGRATGLSSLFSGIATVSRDSEKAISAMSSLGDEATQAGSIISRLFGDSGAGGQIAAFAGKSRDLQEAFLSIGILIVGSLIPAIIALSASLVAAVAGAAGLATAFLAALGPAVVLLVGLFARFAKILQARKAAQQEDNQATNTAADAAKRAAAAEEARYQASIRVRDALQGVATAERGLAEARKQAAENIRNLADRDADAQRGVQSAVEDLGRADADVSAARKKARQDIIDLADKEAQAARTLARARVDASRSIEAAEERLRRAHESVADAARKAGEDAVAAADRQQEAVQRVIDAQYRLADAILAVEGANLSVEAAQLRVNELLSKTPELATAAFSALQRIKDVDFGPANLAGVVQGINMVGGSNPSKDANELKRALLALAQARLGVKEAANRQKEAENNLSKAQRDANTASKTATDNTNAYRDALRQVADAERELRDAQIQGARAIADASRAYKAAAKESREAQRTGVEGSTAVKNARRAERDAAERLLDAQRKLVKADRDLNEARRVGINGSPEVIAAQERLRDAYEQLGEARHNAARAGKDELEKLPAATLKTKNAVDDLTESERRFGVILDKTIKAFTGILQPATDAIFNALADALTMLEPYVGALRELFTQLGNVWAKKIRQAARALLKPAWRDALREIFEGSIQIADYGLDAFGSMLEILRNVAQAVMPRLIELVEQLRDGLGRMSDETSNIGKLRRTFDGLIDSFLAITDLLGSVIGLLFDFGVAVGPIGDGIVGSLNDSVNALREFIRSKTGLDIIKRFFKDTLPLAKTMGDLIVNIGILLGALFELAAPSLNSLFTAFDGLVKFVGRLLIAIRALLDLDFDGFAKAGAAAIKALLGAFTNPIGVAKGVAFMGSLALALGATAGLFFPVGVAMFAAVKLGFEYGGKAAQVAFRAVIAALAVLAAPLIPLFTGIGIEIELALQNGMTKGGAAVKAAFAAIMAAMAFIGETAVAVFGFIGTAISEAIAAGVAFGTAVATAAMAALATAMELAIALGPFVLIGGAIILAIVEGLKHKDAIVKAIKSAINAAIKTLRDALPHFKTRGGAIVTALAVGLATLPAVLTALAYKAIRGILGKFGVHLPDMSKIGGKVADAIAGGISRGYNTIVNGAKRLVGGIVGAFAGIGNTIYAVMKPVVNVVIAVINGGIRALNFLIRGINSIPNIKTPFGSVGIPDIRQLGLVPQLAKGGVATRSTLAEIGEAGKEAVLPLTRAVFDDLGESIAKSLRVKSMAPLALGGQAGVVASTSETGGKTVQHFHIESPPGTQPDIETTVALLSKKLRQRPGSIAR